MLIFICVLACKITTKSLCITERRDLIYFSLAKVQILVEAKKFNKCFNLLWQILAAGFIIYNSFSIITVLSSVDNFSV